MKKFKKLFGAFCCVAICAVSAFTFTGCDYSKEEVNQKIDEGTQVIQGLTEYSSKMAEAFYTNALLNSTLENSVRTKATYCAYDRNNIILDELSMTYTEKIIDNRTIFYVESKSSTDEENNYTGWQVYLNNKYYALQETDEGKTYVECTPTGSIQEQSPFLSALDSIISGESEDLPEFVGAKYEDGVLKVMLKYTQYTSQDEYVGRISYVVEIQDEKISKLQMMSYEKATGKKVVQVMSFEYGVSLPATPPTSLNGYTAY